MKKIILIAGAAALVVLIMRKRSAAAAAGAGASTATASGLAQAGALPAINLPDSMAPMASPASARHQRRAHRTRKT